MNNALSPSSGAPPAPNPDPMPQGNALMPGQGQAPGQGGPQGQQSPPPPSHKQTVVALRHFGAIESELKGLLADPDCGKTNMKDAIIDATAKLVAQGIMTPATAVTQLGTVPERPFDQKQFLMQHLVQTIQGADMILDHHRAAYAGGAPNDGPVSTDDHANVVNGLISQYKGAAHG